MYNHTKIEKKWQKYWDENKTFKVENPSPLQGGDAGKAEGAKPKYYVLDMFPYPSGAGLHVGHPEGMTANDIVARYKNAKGFNVLHPMGWDAFGLPAENYAIKTGTHPRITTDENISNFKRQIKSLGFSYDWDREIDTTDPQYYKWTQWIFLKLYEKGLAYEQDLPINYCPSCKTGLANEEVLNDFSCERCGETVEKKKIRQWVLAITKYADRLLKDVDKLDWPEGIKEMQRNWIGKSEGCEFTMKLAQKNKNSSSNGSCLNDKAKFLYVDSILENTLKVKKKKELSISVYTTRIDTVFGMTYAVLAPDHKDVEKFITSNNQESCEKYITDAGKKSDQDRTADNKEKTGVFTGSYVINPFNGKEVPLWIADYVLGNYGTGAVMAVPAHDLRDFEFAKKYDLEIIYSIGSTEMELNTATKSGEPIPVTEEIIVLKNGEIVGIPTKEYQKAQTKLGILINSGDFSELSSKEAQTKLAEFAEENNFGTRKVNYKLRDWLFSRQRYWGEPIPLIHLKNEDIAKLDTKKMKVAIPQVGVTHNGDSAKLSSIRSILEDTKKVKRNYKKIQFDNLYLEEITEKGVIIFDGKKLRKHFYSKKPKEVRFRKNHGKTIINELKNIVYESQFVGYITVSGKVFRVILEKKGNKKYEVKTYYSTQKYTKILNLAYLTEKKDGDYLMIKGQEFSKVRDGVYGKIVCDYNLPLELPDVERFEPNGSGESPLADVESFVNVQLAENLVGKRETNTMPQWGGSCWYYLRYMNPNNKDMLVDPEVEKYWGQVDSYVGGAEHAVLHLLYARFWHKFLFDIGVVSNDEPFYRLRNQGLITAHSFENSKGKLIANDLVEEKKPSPQSSPSKGEEATRYFDTETGEELKKVIAKMSKSLKNVVNPDEIVEQYGADTLRLYEMYMADFKDSAPWDTKNIIGVKRFLDKVERAFYSPLLGGGVQRTEGGGGKFAENDLEAIKILNKTIKKVEEDIENYKFNTAIAQMMILVNYGRPTDEKLFIQWKEKFVVILGVFAPFLAEELYEKLCKDVSMKHLNKRSVFFAKWPEVDENLLVENTITIAVQVLGKVRGTIEINADENKDSVFIKAKENENVAKWLEGKNLVKEIYVPGRIVNLVVK